MSSKRVSEAAAVDNQTINDLKRKLKSQQMQFNNEKLLLEHKNELLRQELLEVKEREINQAKLHESMFNKGKRNFNHNFLICLFL